MMALCFSHPSRVYMVTVTKACFAWCRRREQERGMFILLLVLGPQLGSGRMLSAQQEVFTTGISHLSPKYFLLPCSPS